RSAAHSTRLYGSVRHAAPFGKTKSSGRAADALRCTTIQDALGPRSYPPWQRELSHGMQADAPAPGDVHLERRANDNGVRPALRVAPRTSQGRTSAARTAVRAYRHESFHAEMTVVDNLRDQTRRVVDFTTLDRRSGLPLEAFPGVEVLYTAIRNPKGP